MKTNEKMKIATAESETAMRASFEALKSFARRIMMIRKSNANRTEYFVRTFTFFIS